MYLSAPFRSFAFSLLASTAISGHASALEPSGAAVNVEPAVQASGGAGARVLEIEGAVFMGDEIVAGPSGLAQIRFIDDTKLVVGPSSRLVIDKFVFNQDNTARQVTINMVKGAFRFITGKSPHEAYTLRTPTMHIGVRGSVVDVGVFGGISTAAFTDGSGDICDNSGNCLIASDDCTLHIVTNGQVRTAGRVETQLLLARAFPFIAAQGALDPAFRSNVGSCAAADSRFFGTPEEPSGSGVPYQ
jgi:hypothetical protein